jgi:hypothetical protein
LSRRGFGGRRIRVSVFSFSAFSLTSQPLNFLSIFAASELCPPWHAKASAAGL